MNTGILLAVLLVGFQSPKAQLKPWVTVVSQEGQFLVNMPVPATLKVSTTEESPQGSFRMIMVGCETQRRAAYTAGKLLFSSQIPQGLEESFLNFGRDLLVNKYKGKITSEKSVRLESGAHGRDFTMRGQLEPGLAQSTIRVREYIGGPSIYITLSLSAPGHELPDDVSRFFGSFQVGTKRVQKKGYKELEGKPIAGWGTAVNPDGDCNIHLEDKTLVMEVPAKLKDLNSDIDLYNSPRVSQTVEGDFSIQVKVGGEFKPGAKPLRNNAAPYQGGAIYVWNDEDNFISLHRGAVLTNGRLGTFAMFVEIEGGSRGGMHNARLNPGPAYLRLERRGRRMSAFVSNDGKSWSQIPPIDGNRPGRLTIGVFAVNTSDAPLTVRFDNLSVKSR